ncbi:MAG: hypothetical protein U0230_21445 [Polyangiales bacterium]
MTSFVRLGVAFGLVACAVPHAAHAMPPPEQGSPGDTVIVEEGTPGGPIEVVEETPSTSLVPAPAATPTPTLLGEAAHTDPFSPERDERLWRASRGLAIERWGTIIGPIGIAMSVMGLYIYVKASDSDERSTGLAAMVAGYGTAATFQIIGSSGAMVASGQLRHLGITPHRRGLATASLVFSFIPGGQLIGWILLVAHRQTTLALCRAQPRGPNGPTFSFRPWVDPVGHGAGSGLVLRF